MNDNVSGIESVLYCPAFVSFKFRDADGKRQSVPVSDARLYIQRPRRLLFEVKSLTGTIAALGSNQDRYWFWAEETLWWGSWARITDPATRRLPVPPDELHDALGLRPLPERLGNGLKPLLRIDGDDHRLLFVRLDEEGEAAGWREVRLQPHEPYLPLEITDRLADGRVLMQATLGNYKRVGKDGPSTPRKYIVEWPLDEAELRLDITRARFRPELEDYPFDKFPSNWTGTVVQIDAPDPPPGLSPADPGGMKR